MSSKEKASTASLQEKLLGDEESLIEQRLLEHPSYIELQSKLTEAEKKAADNWDKLLRMQAEKENMAKRASRDLENAHKYGIEKLIMELLPIIDGLERAVLTLADEHSKVLEGINLTLKMFKTAFEKFGIEQLDPISKPFNPELHQAVSTEVSSEVAAGTVLKVLQKGYLLNNRLIRPALVIVAKAS